MPAVSENRLFGKRRITLLTPRGVGWAWGNMKRKANFDSFGVSYQGHCVYLYGRGVGENTPGDLGHDSTHYGVQVTHDPLDLQFNNKINNYCPVSRAA